MIMLADIWSGKNKLYWLLIPLSLLYGLVVGIRRLAYRAGILPSWHSPVPIVVVGNLTVGGNGKTPFVIWLVEQLRQKGLKVGVVSRGYGGKVSAYPLILTSESLPAEAGDEPVLIYQRTRVPLAVAPKRIDAVKALVAQSALDIIISDDGLQHYALKRDLECVVIDGVRRFGNGWWLPAGPMRERQGRLNSVDLIINNSGSIQDYELAMTLQPAFAVNLVTGEQKPVTELGQIHAIAGIGNPARFFSTLVQLGVTTLTTTGFADHQSFSLEQLQSIASENQTLLMTEKDAVKCRSFAKNNWWYLPVSANFSANDSQIILKKIEKILRKQ